MNWKYFKIEEFDDPNVEGSAAENMDFNFITLLNTIRHQSGVKMPSFVGYMLWSFGILVPVYLLVTFIFI